MLSSPFAKPFNSYFEVSVRNGQERSIMVLWTSVVYLLQALYPRAVVEGTCLQCPHTLFLGLRFQESAEEQISQFLKGFSDILLGQSPLETLVSDDNHRMYLKQALDMSAVEVKIYYDSIHNSFDTDIMALHQEIKNLHHHMAQALLHDKVGLVLSRE